MSFNELQWLAKSAKIAPQSNAHNQTLFESQLKQLGTISENSVVKNLVA